MGFFSKLGKAIRNTIEVVKIVDNEFSISDKVIDNFAKSGVNPKMSKPTRDIIEILEKYNIEYELEKTFDDCYNRRKLPFDFCIYTKNSYFLIEYDGVQHYKPCFGLNEEQKMENFFNTKNNDVIKDQYCKEHNIKLYRIAYNENHIERITQILKRHHMI